MSSPPASPITKLADSPLPLFILAAIAGGMDALVMLHSRNLLAVYMTGNTTKLGQSLIAGAWDKVLPLACVIASFFAATTAAAWIGSRVPQWRATICLALTASMLLLALPFAGEKYATAGACLIAAGMGAVNQTRADQPGVTFITGVLVSTGRHIADGKFRAAATNLLRWASLLAGAAIGALLDFLLGTGALAIFGLAALACALTAFAYRRAHAGSDRRSSHDGEMHHVRE